MRRVKNVVFDFGNVLFNWSPIELVREHFAAHLEPSVSPEQFTQRWMNEHWLRYDLGEIDTRAVAQKMAPLLECERDPLETFISHIPHVLPTLPRSVDLLQRLFGERDAGADFRVFYLSNMPREFADVLEARFDWIRRFDGGLFSGRIQLAKPDPSIYAALESRCALTPQETLFLDDVLVNIEAARTRGWQTIHVRDEADVVNAAEMVLAQ